MGEQLSNILMGSRSFGRGRSVLSKNIHQLSGCNSCRLRDSGFRYNPLFLQDSSNRWNPHLLQDGGVSVISVLSDTVVSDVTHIFSETVVSSLATRVQTTNVCFPWWMGVTYPAEYPPCDNPCCHCWKRRLLRYVRALAKGGLKTGVVCRWGKCRTGDVCRWVRGEREEGCRPFLSPLCLPRSSSGPSWRTLQWCVQWR